MKLCRFEARRLRARSGHASRDGAEVVDGRETRRCAHPLGDALQLAARRCSRASSSRSGSTTPTTSPRAAWRRRSSRSSSTSRSTCVVGPDADVHLPRVSNLLDYEGELAFVIGARCRHVARRTARTR